MDPLALRTQLHHNNKDLEEFSSDLKSWGEEMKLKDAAAHNSKELDTQIPLPRSKVKKISEGTKVESERKKLIKGCDYAAWDKFDVEAECAKIDEDDDQDESGDLTDEYDESAQEEALYEKEKGNTFVKNQQWDQAITCYTKAIQSYAYDPVFYANRALCYLKKENFRAAESDCTTALQIDKTYVKAYQRRASARESLKQYADARTDLLNVFDYEPNNKESRNMLKRVESKLEKEQPTTRNKTENNPEQEIRKSKFATMRERKKKSSSTVEDKREAADEFWTAGDVEVVQAMHKTVQARSKIPLKRIFIEETGSLEELSLPRPGTVDSNSIRCDDFIVVERKQKATGETVTNTEYSGNLKHKKNEVYAIPATSTQFHLDWRGFCGDLEAQYNYLKLVDAKCFPTFFEDTLESEVFGGIIQTLSKMFIKNGLTVYEYLVGLSQVRRFSILCMFMSGNDKKAFLDLVDFMRRNASISADDINQLIKVYGV